MHNGVFEHQTDQKRFHILFPAYVAAFREQLDPVFVRSPSAYSGMSSGMQQLLDCNRSHGPGWASLVRFHRYQMFHGGDLWFALCILLHQWHAGMRWLARLSVLCHHGAMVSLWRSWSRARGSLFPNREVASVGGLAGCAVLQVADEIERASDEERATDEVPDRGHDEVPHQSVSSQTPAQLLRHT